MRVTGAPAGTPLRFATLDYYDGGVWGAGSRAGHGLASTRARRSSRSGSGSARRGDGKPATLQVTIPEGGYSDVWLPTVGQVTGVKFAGARADQLASRLWLNTDTSTAIVPDRLSAGDRYTMHVLLPTKVVRDKLPDVAVHRDRQPRREPGARLPRRAGRRLEPRRRGPVGRAAGGGRGDARRRRLHRRRHQELRRELLPRRATPAAGWPVSSGATQLAGNDEQYAATLALVANRLDIPTRVVMGAVLPEGGVVKGRDVHAWVEVQDEHRHVDPVAGQHLPARPQPEAQPAPVQDRRAEDRRPRAAAGRDQPAERAAGTRPGAERREPQEAPEEAVRPVGLAGRGCAGWSSTSLLPLLVLVGGLLADPRRQGLASAAARHPGHGDGPGRVGVGRPDEQRAVVRPRPAPPGHPAGAGRRARPTGRRERPCHAGQCAHLRTRHARRGRRRGLLGGDQRGAWRPAGQLRLLAPTALRRRPAAAVRPRAGDPGPAAAPCPPSPP